MIVVSDTTPLRHLIAIGKVDLLQKAAHFAALANSVLLFEGGCNAPVD